MTPGPWKVGPLATDERGCHYIEVAAGPVSVAWIHLGLRPTKAEIAEGREDAAALAALPDLLAALRDVVDRFDPEASEVECPGLSDAETAVIRRARAALAAASGAETGGPAGGEGGGR